VPLLILSPLYRSPGDSYHFHSIALRYLAQPTLGRKPGLHLTLTVWFTRAMKQQQENFLFFFFVNFEYNCLECRQCPTIIWGSKERWADLPFSLCPTYYSLFFLKLMHKLGRLYRCAGNLWAACCTSTCQTTRKSWLINHATTWRQHCRKRFCAAEKVEAWRYEQPICTQSAGSKQDQDSSDAPKR
jgi:hypothetical protein